MSERRQSKILQSKLRHLKIYQSSSEMLNFHSEYAQCGHKPEAIFHKGFINKLWKHMLVAHLPWKFGNVICDNKVFVALRHTSFYFNISALDPHQSIFWRFCKSLTCTISMIQLYDPVIFSGITVSENSSTIPVWGKRCFDLCGCCAASFMAQNDAQSFLWDQSRYSTELQRQKQDLLNILFNEIFCPEFDVEDDWWHEASLHKLLRRYVGWCLWWSLMPY